MLNSFCVGDEVQVIRVRSPHCGAVGVITRLTSSGLSADVRLHRERRVVTLRLASLRSLRPCPAPRPSAAAAQRGAGADDEVGALLDELAGVLARLAVAVDRPSRCDGRSKTRGARDGP